MMRVVAIGWWCETCEFFEDEDQIDLMAPTCTSCGCLSNNHVSVEVATKGLV